ncbi:kinesin-like protein, partial [Volvox carteri f. nagariensis]
LVNASAGIGERKRKADAMLQSDAAPDAKRPTFSMGQAAGRATTLQQATSARTAPTQLQPVSEIAPAVEELWEDIIGRTGQTADDVLNKKMSFPKNTKPERKVEAFVPVVKELKALGRYLTLANQRLEMDVEQWKVHSAQLSQQLEENERQWNIKQQEVDKKMQEIGELLELQVQETNKLQEQLAEKGAMVVAKEAACSALQLELDGVNAELARTNKNLEEANMKIQKMEESALNNQQYMATLHTYNTSLQADVRAEQARCEELQRTKDELAGHLAELGGKMRSLEQMLAYEREQLTKLREEREVSARDTAVLRADLEDMRLQRERALTDASKAKEDLERLRAAGGKSLEALETLNNDKATMEAQLSMQRKLIASMSEELAGAKEGRAMAEALAETRAVQLAENKASIKAEIENLQASLMDAERRNYEGELIRRKLHNIIQDLKGNIRVYCRVRPVSSAEASDKAHDSGMALDFPTDGDLLGRGLSVAVTSGQSTQKHTFAFDRVFSPGTTQENVFDELSELVQSALDGHKVCIFAYGQTGSGKTFTMLGSRDHPGVIPRAMQQIFQSGQKLAAQDWQFKMQASMLEIYNEEIRDLLVRRKEDKKHQVSHDTNGVTTVSDLTVVDVNKPEAVEQLLAQAMEKRSVGCTALNEQSSRSHMVFMMRIEGHNTITDAKVSGVLNLIDLAGSERVKESGAVGQRLEEAKAINKSLSALGDVIAALANKQEHVPFRNSKLTYLLQPCLGGESKTLMFLNVAPTREFANESLCSLRFGSKVNACEINVPKKKNVMACAQSLVSFAVYLQDVSFSVPQAQHKVTTKMLAAYSQGFVGETNNDDVPDMMTRTVRKIAEGILEAPRDLKLRSRSLYSRPNNNGQ